MDAPEEERLAVSAQIAAAWDDVVACQEASRLVFRNAPDGITRFDLTSPVSVDRVMNAAIACAHRRLCRHTRCWLSTILMSTGTSSFRACASPAGQSTLHAGGLIGCLDVMYVFAEFRSDRD